MSMLEKAIAIAADAHEGAFDKAGAPYILHPLRVMLKMETLEERITAVLHDVVEDAAHKGWTFDRLRQEGFSEQILASLESVTKRPEEKDQEGDDETVKLGRYLQFVSRAARNPIGRRVKKADLCDNLDLSRIDRPTQKDLDRIERYRHALRLLDSMQANT